jgi:hypothetical protein
MTVPALAYLRKIRLPPRRAALWLLATVVGTITGMQVLHWVLVNFHDVGLVILGL